MKNRGFTLIELMLVVAIFGILAAIAIPNYNTFMNKSRRSDGITTLLDLQQAQARLRNNCQFYAQSLVNTGNNCAATAADTELDFDTTSPEGHYSLAISAGTASGNAYTATATAHAQGRQLGDTDCRVLVLTVDNGNPNGARSSLDADGNASSGCW